MLLLARDKLTKHILPDGARTTVNIQTRRQIAKLEQHIFFRMDAYDCIICSAMFGTNQGLKKKAH